MAALAVLIAGAACGKDPVDPPNRPPEAVGEIEPQTIEEGKRWQANISTYFNDPDKDNLTYKAESSDSDVASASMAGANITVTGVSAGTCVVTITATDPDDESAEQKVDITVTPANRPPFVVREIEDETIKVDSVRNLDISQNFADPDPGDRLTMSASSDDTDIVTAVATQNFEVRIEGISAGTATVTVTATDQGGLSVSDDFEVTVEASSPPPAMAGGTASSLLPVPVYSVKIVRIESRR